MQYLHSMLSDPVTRVLAGVLLVVVALTLIALWELSHAPRMDFDDREGN